MQSSSTRDWISSCLRLQLDGTIRGFCHKNPHIFVILVNCTYLVCSPNAIPFRTWPNFKLSEVAIGWNQERLLSTGLRPCKAKTKTPDLPPDHQKCNILQCQSSMKALQFYHGPLKSYSAAADVRGRSSSSGGEEACRSSHRGLGEPSSWPSEIIPTKRSKRSAAAGVRGEAGAAAAGGERPAGAASWPWRGCSIKQPRGSTNLHQQTWEAGAAAAGCERPAGAGIVALESLLYQGPSSWPSEIIPTKRSKKSAAADVRG